MHFARINPNQIRCSNKVSYISLKLRLNKNVSKFLKEIKKHITALYL